MDYLRKRSLNSIDASEQQTEEWAKGVWAIANMSLIPKAKSV